MTRGILHVSLGIWDELKAFDWVGFSTLRDSSTSKAARRGAETPKLICCVFVLTTPNFEKRTKNKAA